jgi:alcohol dehydrogenase (NADP+)
MAFATLNTGAQMPLVGLGTFLSTTDEVQGAVRAALKAGYRHIDCAAAYRNEDKIGEVFAEFFNDPKSGVKREDVFITSKCPPMCTHPDTIEATLKKTLKDLQLEALDLYLIHQPNFAEEKKEEKGKWTYGKRKGFGIQDSWRVMEKCHEAGLAKAIGISNFNAALVCDMQNYAKVVPAVNQVERHPYLAQNRLVDFHKENGIVTTAYAPLGAPGLMAKKFEGTDVKAPLSCQTIVDIAAKHKKTPAQVLIRWSVEQGVVVIPKSVKPHRIVENFDVANFKLDADDMKAIAALDRGFRTFEQDWYGVPMFH